MTSDGKTRGTLDLVQAPGCKNQVVDIRLETDKQKDQKPLEQVKPRARLGCAFWLDVGNSVLLPRYT